MIILFLFCCVPCDHVIEDRCDLIEINRVYDECGKLTFEQVIFWDYDEHGDARIVAWRFVKDGVLSSNSSGRFLFWRDKSHYRCVRAVALKRTWTQYDIEVLLRELRPQKERRGLARVK